jgi:hypothetical protein
LNNAGSRLLNIAGLNQKEVIEGILSENALLFPLNIFLLSKLALSSTKYVGETTTSKRFSISCMSHVINEEIESLRSIPKHHTQVVNKKGSATTVRYYQSMKQEEDGTKKLCGKSVTFSPDVMLYHVRHISDYSHEEIRTVWYDHVDLAAVKAECVSTVIMILEQQPLDPNTHCSRGLEYRMPEGMRRRHRNKLGARNAVLDEQDIQWERDENNVEVLAAVCRASSLPCQAMAHQTALGDEQSCIRSLYDSIPLKKLLVESRRKPAASRRSLLKKDTSGALPTGGRITKKTRGTTSVLVL